ncbi:hypothetical protein GQF56_21515 [Rhodobacter sphaeroides]|jgi:hypothetical protein|uniref:TIGR03016 family PEP-CTERM system-associated outer membrane protein n=1 Tax=Cereibacter sphaeroides (strain ATCC 17023 / DSM 158 / JCM 6121 / CCUG 31486 / LMG 2827 / NBRC 12203 / NCIMB 8253 / ATH 2.4.1.) TaxID=272943 RepID=Q3IV96_CERS4|nr:hypothetical protein [Cereibacter sphaeroides]ABA81538.1 hypothetical protein RSP_4063 [Cereibacter sphaeroides 2.4.1]AMJ50150.1 hypothetical protein APX01_21610 [Cereibacter sphaeroides]ATN65889.1 hypothetical protein A3857_21455 [Cereibacter sphaeroides]AXC64056.1 hypothetical protein DQL45_22005 [Cereibacter sphaeroides 2.4.1]MVX50404.1 hypothetical protein [Cereibacter sphaeroides]
MFLQRLTLTLSVSALALAASLARADDKAVIVEGTVEKTAPTVTAPERNPASGRVVPLTGRFVLNDEYFDYGQGPKFSALSLAGSSREWDLEISGTHPIHQSVHETVSEQLYLREQEGWYFQLRNVDRRRTTKVTRREAVDIYGFQLDLTVTGGCFFPESAPGTYCTYTPSVAVDPDSINPDTLIPGAFIFGEDTGAVISQETHEALKAEGFQRGLDGGDETVGVSLSVPNSGYEASESRSNLNSVERYESVDKRIMGGLYKFRQVLSSNSTMASLARTTRGLVFLDANEWTDKAAATQLLAWLLPSARAPLQATDRNARLSIGNNLFLAANNTRLPADSFTAYHAGVGYVDHPKKRVRSAADTPRSVFNSFWMGFSPVRDITTGSSSRLQVTGPRESLLENGYAFSQGGIDTALASETAIYVVDQISEQIAQIELANIDDLFIQSGLDLTRQDAMAIYTTTEESRYKYVPHLAFSGNVTSGTSVSRYYAGAILGDETNAYVGFDHSYTGLNGFSFYLLGEHYTHPDRDYFSKVEARISKAVQLRNGAKLSFGVSAAEELDRAPAQQESVTLNDNDRTLDVAMSYRTPKGLTYSLSHRLVQAEDGDDAESTSVGFSYRASDDWSFTAQITPTSTEDAYIAARAGFSWRQSGRPGSPVLGVQWASIRYDYGEDQFGNDLRDREDTLLVSYKMSF